MTDPGPASPFTPRPGAAPVHRMLARQAGFEIRLLLRNGEQLLLTAVIPVVLLVVLATVPVIDTAPYSRVDFVVPGILSLAVMSTSFTSLAIATGYERRYGVLRLLSTTPLPRWALLLAKALTVLVIQALQFALVVGIGATLGWQPHGSVVAVVLLAVMGTLAFSGLALVMAGTMRAEATLAAANLVYLVLLVAGGVIVPVDRFPDGIAAIATLTPTGALSESLRSVLADGTGVPWSAVAVLAAWSVIGFAAAAAWFRWDDR